MPFAMIGRVMFQYLMAVLLLAVLFLAFRSRRTHCAAPSSQQPKNIISFKKVETERVVVFFKEAGFPYEVKVTDKGEVLTREHQWEEFRVVADLMRISDSDWLLVCFNEHKAHELFTIAAMFRWPSDEYAAAFERHRIRVGKFVTSASSELRAARRPM